MKRFYKEVSVGEGNAVLVDGTPVRTPGRAALALPTHALAEAVAEEWRAQGEEIVPDAMPLTKLANTAIDRVPGATDEVVESILAYANDHLCYRAEAPAELVARQHAKWDPMLAWAAQRYGARLNVSVGIIHIDQPPEAVAGLHRAVACRDPFTLTALHAAATILGSLVLALALLDGRLDAAEAFALSQLDERYQAEKWGSDPLAEARTRRLFAELNAAARFMTFLSSP